MNVSANTDNYELKEVVEAKDHFMSQINDKISASNFNHATLGMKIIRRQTHPI